MPNHKLMFILSSLLMFSATFSFVGSNFIKSRTWHEAFSVAPRTSLTKSKGLSRVLYSNYKWCVAPGDRQEQVKIKQEYSHPTATETTWSELLSIFTGSVTSELYSWDYWKREVDTHKVTFYNQTRAATIYIILFFVISVILYIIYATIIGSILFMLCMQAWSLIFHPETRRLCRRILITKEKLLIYGKSFLPQGRGYKVRRQFRLPYYLREYPEEEIPAELTFPSDDDSDGEVSSDGFEDLLIRKKEAVQETAVSHTNTKALLHLMASAERELASSKSSSTVTSLR